MKVVLHVNFILFGTVIRKADRKYSLCRPNGMPIAYLIPLSETALLCALPLCVHRAGTGPLT